MKPRPTDMKQLDDEARQDYIKFLVFVGLGPNRSLDQAYKQYYETTNEVTANWHTLAAKHHWLERASEYDARVTVR